MEENTNNVGASFADKENDLKGLFDEIASEDSTPLKMRCILEGVGRNAGADRAYVYFLRDSERSIWDNVYEWCAEGIASIQAKQQGADMSMFPDMSEALMSGQIYSFTDIDKAHPSVTRVMKPQGLKAMIIAPICGSDGSVSGCVGFDFFKTHPNPIPATTVKNLMEAVNMISSCLRFKREQEMSRMTDNVLLEIGVGVWAFELDEGMPPRMYGNKAMDELLGCDGSELTPEQYYHAWYDHVHPAHRQIVDETVQQLVGGRQAEAQYPFLHPVRGQVWVRCGGRRDWSYKKGVRIVGRHQDITELLHVQKDNAAELGAVQRLAENERDRADKERDINTALELIVEERDFMRVLKKIMALWCRSLGAQWAVLGQFVDHGFKVVHAYSVFGDAALFEEGEVLNYVAEVSGDATSGADRDFISLVDFQKSPAVDEIARMSSSPRVIRNVASCHSRVVRFKNERWGSIVLLFQNRHEVTDNELRFITASAHGIELAMLRRELDRQIDNKTTEVK